MDESEKFLPHPKLSTVPAFEPIPCPTCAGTGHQVGFLAPPLKLILNVALGEPPVPAAAPALLLELQQARKVME